MCRTSKRRVPASHPQINLPERKGRRSSGGLWHQRRVERSPGPVKRRPHKEQRLLGSPLVARWLGLSAVTAVAWAHSLDGELGSCKTQGTAKKIKEHAAGQAHSSEQLWEVLSSQSRTQTPTNDNFKLQEPSPDIPCSKI